MKILPVSIPEDIDKYFFNRKKDIAMINTQLSTIKLDIPPLLLITGSKGIGKTFLIKKIFKDLSEDILTAYVDLSRFQTSLKGKVTEEEVLKAILSQIITSLSRDEKFYRKWIGKITSNIEKLGLKNYDFSNSANIFDLPLPVISDNYDKLSKFVMELPQKIVDASDEIKGFIIAIDEFQLLKNVENPEAFFWLIRSFTQKQFNVGYIFTGSVSKTFSITAVIPDSSNFTLKLPLPSFLAFLVILRIGSVRILDKNTEVIIATATPMIKTYINWFFKINVKSDISCKFE